MCFQTIGSNFYFKEENSIIAIKKLINLTEYKGDLILNIGPESKNYISEIKNDLAKNFCNIIEINYGSFKNETNILISIILSYLMYFFPFLRTISNNDETIYLCLKKI